MFSQALPFAVVAALFFAIPSESKASVVINLGSANLSSDSGTAAQAGTLIQLINLGDNGVLDPIDISDGNVNGLARWVSGDDSVLNIPFEVILGMTTVPGDFASTKA